MEDFRASTDLNNKLGLMAPFQFRRFTENACRSVSRITFEFMAQIFTEQANGAVANHPNIQSLRPSFALEIEVRSKLTSATEPFFAALGHFEQVLMNFRLKLQAAGPRAENQGAGWGVIGAVIGGVLLGPFGAVAVACGAGFFGGNLIEQEMQRDAEQLQNVFCAMLGEYDNTMSRLSEVAWDLIGKYNNAVESAIQAVGHINQKGSPASVRIPGQTKLAPAFTRLAPPPRLLVEHGKVPNQEYLLEDGRNVIGRYDNKHVDIDLTGQEDAANPSISRQHAVIIFQNAQLFIEDSDRSNGTFVNRVKIPPGQEHPLRADDIIRIGRVSLKVLF